MEQGRTKREMILDSALSLFAERGFDGVGVDEIADAVGMKGPGLYYYFKGKDALLDAIVEKQEIYYREQFGDAMNIKHYPETLEEFISLSMERLDFSIHDPHIRKVRKLLAMEQFRNVRIKKLATQHNLDGVVRLNTVFLEKLIEKGQVKAYPARQLAFEFSTPVALLIQWVDREPEMEEEIMKQIKAHMEHFVKVYAIDFL